MMDHRIYIYLSMQPALDVLSIYLYILLSIYLCTHPLMYYLIWLQTSFSLLFTLGEHFLLEIVHERGGGPRGVLSLLS